MPPPQLDEAENEARMLRDVTMRVTGSIKQEKPQEENLWSFGTSEKLLNILDDKTPLPPVGATDEEEALALEDYPYIDGPIKVDYGINLKIGKGVYINFNNTFLDTCQITIGARTLIGPNCSFYAATHPLDPFLRNGVNGPELGAPITIGEDCWFGGSVVVLPGVIIGRGVTVGAGSVVTKDVPAFHVVAGNPAKIIKKIEPKEPDPTLVAEKSTEVTEAVANRAQ